MRHRSATAKPFTCMSMRVCVCLCACVCVSAVAAVWQCGHGYVCRTRTVRMAHTRLAHAFLLCASLISPPLCPPPAATFACKFDAKTCEIFDFKRRRCRSCCRVLLLLLLLRFCAQLMPPLPLLLLLLQLQLVCLAEIYGVCMSEFICLFHMQMQPSSNS